MILAMFIVCFVGLFVLSRVLTTTVTYFLYHITKSHGLSVQLLAALLLPGVIIHELAHWLFASLLFVPTGEIEFFPQVQGASVKLGSVQVGKTDIVRRFIIGIAPVVAGVAVIFGVFWFLQPTLVPIRLSGIFFCYVVFEVGNTMFSSKKDLEGAIGFLILLILFLLLLVFLQVPVQEIVLSFLAMPTVGLFFSQVTMFLLVALGIDGLCIVLLRGCLWILHAPTG